jgi:class 3 adenylate cyclase
LAGGACALTRRPLKPTAKPHSRRGGAANKNIGDAFLLVWKLPRGIRSRELAALANAAEEAASTIDAQLHHHHQQQQHQHHEHHQPSASFVIDGGSNRPTFPSVPGGAQWQPGYGANSGAGGPITAGGAALTAATLDHWPGLSSGGEDGDGSDYSNNGTGLPAAPHNLRASGGPSASSSPARSPLRLSGVGPGALGLAGGGAALAAEALQQAVAERLRTPSRTGRAGGGQQQRRSGGGLFMGRPWAVSGHQQPQQQSVSIMESESGGHHQQPPSELDRVLSQLALQRAHTLAHALSLPHSGLEGARRAGSFSGNSGFAGDHPSHQHQQQHASFSVPGTSGAAADRSSRPHTAAATPPAPADAAAASAAALRRAVNVIKTVRRAGLSAASKGAIVNTVADGALASFVVIQVGRGCFYVFELGSDLKDSQVSPTRGSLGRWTFYDDGAARNLKCAKHPPKKVALAHSSRLRRYSRRADLNARMPGFKVQMGFGLHVGWAIEGPIGGRAVGLGITGTWLITGG